MNEKTDKTKTALLIALAVCLAITGFFIGKSNERSAAQQERERLYALNRSSIENLIVEDGPIYVIGHRSPDSDTVCSAIAYARF